MNAAAIDERLDHFLTLQRDWDSYGAEPPCRSCIAAARWLAHTLIASGARIENLQTVPTSDGEIELSWMLNNTDFEVTVWASPLGEYDEVLAARGADTPATKDAP